MSDELLTLKTWCGRYHLHGPHDDCLGWGDGRVGVDIFCGRCGKGDSGDHDYDCLDGKRP